MRESPRLRRLRSDRKALEKLRDESSIVTFTAREGAPDSYLVRFNGRGFWKPENGGIQIRELHEVHIQLGASYPRMMPELIWKSPIFHPNISASGVVCLGGYGTYWTPSLNLDEMCTMLWDMVRYANFDIESPYNREAAQWAKTQTEYSLPIDVRPIRDRVAKMAPPDAGKRPPITGLPQPLTNAWSQGSSPQEDVVFIDPDEEIVDAEIIEDPSVEGSDIMFIE